MYHIQVGDWDSERRFYNCLSLSILGDNREKVKLGQREKKTHTTQHKAALVRQRHSEVKVTKRRRSSGIFVWCFDAQRELQIEPQLLEYILAVSLNNRCQQLEADTRVHNPAKAHTTCPPQ